MKKLRLKDNRYELLWRILRRHIVRRTGVREIQDNTRLKQRDQDSGIPGGDRT
jgi:hypothetical protein